ncbi:ferritin [Candidatus Fermentibacteria bacterium]|nr:ferritin [Candidatus Fermentibacteria bacterium]
MLTERLSQALNEQVNAELYSAYLYLSMSMYLESIDMSGAAGWMNAQAREEVSHAERIMGYLNDRGARVWMKAIEEPPAKWDSALQVFEESFEHERKVSAMIDHLVDLAREENDHMTENFLQWFVAEQIEEEASVSDVVRLFKLSGDDGGNLLMIDQKLGERAAGALEED